MKFNSKQRRKSIKVWLSDEERILVESKAEFYGYKRLAKYIRDAAIYEKVTYINLKNKEELYVAYSENTKELKKITKEIRHISKYATQLTDETKKNILDIMYAILRNQKSMIKLIDEKLDLDVWKEINHNKIKDVEEKQCQ
ncbi:putative uncharacterized protein [Clostridium sp. CAG:440]|nr:putative uncharacterized protein [Clostridium sp. CAG:440]